MNTLSSMKPTLPPPVQGKYGKVTVLAEGYVGAPHVSGDGHVIVWDQVVGNNSEIMKFEDGQLTQLTHDQHPSIFPATSQDGHAISFTRWSSTDPQDPNGNWDIHQIRDGAQTAVTSGPANAYMNDISRDGNVIVWDTDGDGHWGNFNINKWENGQIEAVTKGRGDRESPVVDGDGKRIVWREGLPDGESHLWMRDENGKAQQLTSARGNQYQASISPDGSRVLYTHNGGPDDDLMLLAGSQPTTVAGERKIDEGSASMTPDGSQIAWTSFDRRKGNPAEVEIFLKDGDEVVQLTDRDGGLPTTPSMSDDGKVLAYLWVNPNDLHHSRIVLLERDTPVPAPPSKH